MEQPNRAIYWCMILSASLLAHSSPTSIAYDRPVHLLVLSTFATGIILIILCRSFPGAREDNDASHLAGNLELEERPSSSLVGDISDRKFPGNFSLHKRKRPRLALVGGVVSLVVRIELFRRVLKATECTINSLEVFIPLVLSVYDGYKLRRPSSSSRGDLLDHDLNETIYNTAHLRFCTSRFRYVLPASLVTFGAHLASGLWSGASSTYICPLVTGQHYTIPLMQVMSVTLDCCLAIAASKLCSQKSSQIDKAGAKASLMWGSVLVAASTFWVVLGFVLFLVKPQYRDLLIPTQIIFDMDHFCAFLWQSVLFAAVCMCSAHCIIYLGILDLSLTLATVWVMVPSISFLWSHRRPFPPVSNIASVWSFVLILGGYLWFRHLRHVSTVSRSINTPTYVIIFFIFLVVLYPALQRPNLVHFHPIDMLTYDAKSHHKQFRSHSTQSHNLDKAVAQYRRRYKMAPPPAFETWYRYASTRNSVIMDQYDQIHEDMLPFWSIPPNQLRQSTWELISSPDNDIGGITIRNGTTSVLDNVPGTHRWMLEGAVVMIQKFSQHLPDMDLAFNLNDEARVAVPNGDIERLRKAAVAVKNRSGKQSWSAARADGWPAIQQEPFIGTTLQDMAFQNTFLDFGSASCEPSSPARAIRDLYSRSHLCLHCIEPHSLGQFLSNWPLSADICHQPDMASLHGFYLSPAAFKGSHALVPIFTQSKPSGFHDILYPSAWNYMDKVLYAPTDPSGDPSNGSYNAGYPDPHFEAKHNTLFWRGATSEGASSGDHTWRGMARQRLVHLANNLTSSAHDAATILLPTESDEGKRYRYTIVPGDAIKDLGLSTDIAIVDEIARCGGPGLLDCKEQEAEFALVPRTDFQSHWQYRYLFDLDGAGFSGRFLPFLQSHSLPFKTALFREWYDERMTAWHHFVPVDIRLHAVWSTLAYFAGVNGTLPDGRRVEMAPHLKEGKWIAERGREWARKALRKEDMEIYFFRVLLEWGRLTDDNRENLGFLPNGDSGGSV